MASIHNKYSVIWEKLKKDKSVTLAIAIPLQPKVIRGIINLKDRDKVFKLEAVEAKKRYIIKYVQDAARVRIFLREFNDMSALTLTDL